MILGDGALTPAVSVLSACEGLETAFHSVTQSMVPAAMHACSMTLRTIKTLACMVPELVTSRPAFLDLSRFALTVTSSERGSTGMTQSTGRTGPSAEAKLGKSVAKPVLLGKSVLP